MIIGDQDLDDDNELSEKLENLKVYLPGDKLDIDEELVADQSTYEMLHRMNVEWPCLSFDIIPDKLGIFSIHFHKIISL